MTNYILFTISAYATVYFSSILYSMYKNPIKRFDKFCKVYFEGKRTNKAHKDYRKHIYGYIMFTGLSFISSIVFLIQIIQAWQQ